MTADVLFTGRPVFTGAGSPLDGHAVAVIGERIARSCPIPRRADRRRPHARDRPAGRASRTRLPGRAHPPRGGGHGAPAVQPHRAPRCRGIVALVAAYAEANPDEPWILGGGWSMDHYPGGAPIRGLLDAVVPDRPVLLEPRPPQHVGEYRRDPARRHRRVDADPVGRADRARGRRLTGRHVPRGRGELFAGVRPGSTRNSRTAACSRPGGTARPRHHRLAGRDGRRVGASPTRSALTAARSPRAR